MIKTFIFDARGFQKGLGGTIDAAVNAWVTAESPTSIDNMDMSMGETTLVIVISYTE